MDIGLEGGDRLEVVWSREAVVSARDPVEAAYGSTLRFSETRPFVFTNFVQTVDGVVVFGERGGWNAADVSMHSAIDRHVMALLRSQADAIIIGAGTVRSAPGHQWSPGGLVPKLAGAFDDLRYRSRGRRGRAHLYVVTASGHVDPGHVAFTAPEAPATVVTTPRGATHLTEAINDGIDVVVMPHGDVIDPFALVGTVADRSGGLILCEGGPTLLGGLFRAGLVDELFLTVAPQLAGRDSNHRRLGLIEGYAALPAETPKAGLQSVRRSKDHLFLRYTIHK